MFEQFRKLCAEHNLIGIGITYLHSHKRHTVYIHYDDGNECASGDGVTFEEAFERALENKS